jgi:hypothetical protein
VVKLNADFVVKPVLGFLAQHHSVRHFLYAGLLSAVVYLSSAVVPAIPAFVVWACTLNGSILTQYINPTSAQLLLVSALLGLHNWAVHALAVEDPSTTSK